MQPDERVILTERMANLGRGKVAKRTAYVEPSDAAEVCVQWTSAEGDESSSVALEPDDLDQLCLWWLGRGRAAYRALVRQSYREHGITPAADGWIARTPDTLHIASQPE